MKIYIVWYRGHGIRDIDDIFSTITGAEKYVDKMIEGEFEVGDIINNCTWSYGKEIVKADGMSHSWIVSERYLNEEL